MATSHRQKRFFFLDWVFLWAFCKQKCQVCESNNIWSIKTYRFHMQYGTFHFFIFLIWKWHQCITFPYTCSVTYKIHGYCLAIWAIICVRVRNCDRGRNLPSPLHVFESSPNIAYISWQLCILFILQHNNTFCAKINFIRDSSLNISGWNHDAKA